MSTEPESLMLRLLRDMRAEMGEMRAEMATKSDLAELGSELRSEMHSLRADVASDIAGLEADIKSIRRDLGDQIAGLRLAVVEYHTSVMAMAP